MTQTIGVGVIGMGWMGAVHSRTYRQIPNRFQDSGIQPRLVICADDVEARAHEAQELLGFERYTTDWKQVIADPEVEVVNITAPNNMHLEIVRAAAGAGRQSPRWEHSNDPDTFENLPNTSADPALYCEDC